MINNGNRIQIGEGYGQINLHTFRNQLVIHDYAMRTIFIPNEDIIPTLVAATHFLSKKNRKLLIKLINDHPNTNF